MKLLQPTAAKLVHLLHQVARGFVALGDAEIVHRDLAARNILVDENLLVKVADYGLSRDVDDDKNYYRITSYNANLPLRWTASAATLSHCHFSNCSRIKGRVLDSPLCVAYVCARARINPSLSLSLSVSLAHSLSHSLTHSHVACYFHSYWCALKFSDVTLVF